MKNAELPPGPRPAPVKKVDARVEIGETGVSICLPALLTPDGVLQTLLDYFSSRSQARSRSWMNKVLRAVSLFVRYASVQPAGTDPRTLLRGFAQSLYVGTLDEEGRDPAGLAWHPLSDRLARDTITLLAAFFEFLVADRPPDAGESAGRYDRLLAQCAYRYRRDKTCLRYTRPANDPARPARAVGDGRRRPPAFPQSRLMDLLFEGFKVGTQHDYRGMLITLLLNGAGFAAFEPFHLYVTDLVGDPLGQDKVSLCIHYPFQAGSDPAAGARMHDAGLRADYLRMRWRMQLRDPQAGWAGGGWKGRAHGPARASAGFLACWRDPEMEVLFGRLWACYWSQLVKIERDHPLAFVNLRAGGCGRPYTVGQFNQAHTAACQRIGLPVAKRFGTTLEGHRLAYHQRFQSGEAQGPVDSQPRAPCHEKSRSTGRSGQTMDVPERLAVETEPHSRCLVAAQSLDAYRVGTASGTGQALRGKRGAG